MAKTLWIDSFVDIQNTSGGTPIVRTLMGTFSSDDTRLGGMTLLRTIIGLHVAHLIHDSGEGSQDVSLGIGVASQQAFALGQAAIPDPQVEADFPPRGWVWRARYRTYGFAADQAAVFDNRVDKDVRSRRKLDNGICYLTTQNTPDQGTSGTTNVLGLIRQLWLIT